MCALRQARILSSETDNTIRQDQNTNVNIKITPSKTQQRPQTVPLYPNVPPMNNVNFTQANQSTEFQQAGQTTYIPTEESTFPSVQPINNQFRERGIADLSGEIEDLEKKNKFLQMLVEMYEMNPLKVNSYVICESKLLMNMIKLLTDCEKVDLVLNEDISCGGCTGNSDKIIYVSKILVTKDGKTSELKYDYNNIYSEFVKYGISLKMVC